MLINTIDENSLDVRVDVDEYRVAAWDHFLRSNPHILGYGVGSRFGKPRALDAVEAMNFAVSQLAYVEQKEFLRQYQPQLFETLLGAAISREAGAGAQTVEYEIVDDAGMGKRISPASNDIPLADSASSRKSLPVALGAIGYQYNTEDIRISAYTNKPLTLRKNRAAQRGFMSHMNQVALLGEAGSNFFGLYNNSSITASNRPSGAVWDAATADTIINDLISLMTSVLVQTKNNSAITIIAMPISSYGLLIKPRGTQSDTNILRYILGIYPGLTIVPDDILVNAGAGGTKRVVGFNPDNDNMVLHMPMPLTFLPPQFVDLNVKVVGEYKYAGLEVRRILSAIYMDGV
jgi:hypothetical protein